jgi:hypothetical protein
VGIAFGWLAGKPSATSRGAVGAAALFLCLHGAIHIAHAIGEPSGLADLLRDFPGVLLPALLAAWLAWPFHKDTRNA